MRKYQRHNRRIIAAKGTHMPTRNDDPPEDRAAEEQAALHDKVHDELMDLRFAGTYHDTLGTITEYVVKKINEAYTDGYVDGMAAHHSEGE
jgi:hypothetical protein